MACRSSSMPDDGVYLVKPALMAASAAALTGSGVSKSGSPEEKSTTSRPWAAMALAVAVMARVGEGVIRDTRAASFMLSNSGCVPEEGGPPQGAGIRSRLHRGERHL